MRERLKPMVFDDAGRPENRPEAILRVTGLSGQVGLVAQDQQLIAPESRLGIRLPLVVRKLDLVRGRRCLPGRGPTLSPEDRPLQQRHL